MLCVLLAAALCTDTLTALRSAAQCDNDQAVSLPAIKLTRIKIQPTKTGNQSQKATVFPARV